MEVRRLTEGERGEGEGGGEGESKGNGRKMEGGVFKTGVKSKYV